MPNIEILTGTTPHTHVIKLKSMISTEKIIKELSKGTTEEMLENLELIKSFIITQLTEEQAIADELANKKQSQIDRLNNVN